MRKLDDIIPPSKRREMGPEGTLQTPSPEPLRTGERQTSSFPYRTALVALLVVAATVFILFYFSSSKIEVTPTSASVSVGGSFVASQGSGDLPYEIVSAEKIATQNVQGSGTKTVSESASGTVTIYNTQARTQPLVANTRFATKSGLIFRIHSSVTVPKGTAANPGMIQAVIYADKPGDSYNVGPTTFTLPGLASTPQFSQVYAISSGATSGGASGVVPVIAPNVEAGAREALTKTLEADLVRELQASVPEGYVLLPGAATTTFSALSSTPSSTTGTVDVREQGTISAIVFPERALASALAKQSMSGNYGGEPLSLASTETLRLSAPLKPSPEMKSYSFSLSGVTTLVYVIDGNRIAAAVAGKTRASAEVALTTYPEVKRAVLILRPFWRQSFPEDPASIQIVTEKP